MIKKDIYNSTSFPAVWGTANVFLYSKEDIYIHRRGEAKVQLRESTVFLFFFLLPFTVSCGPPEPAALLPLPSANSYRPPQPANLLPLQSADSYSPFTCQILTHRHSLECACTESPREVAVGSGGQRV